jgi:hypothetical protein
MSKTTGLSVIALLSLAAGAAQAVDMKLKSDQDLFSLSSSNTSSFWVGNNPSACALLDDNLFIAGYANGPATTAYIVKIETIFGTRSFRQVPSSASALPSARGFTGMAVDAKYDNAGALTSARLLASYDSGANGTANSTRMYDIGTQLNPILLKGTPAGDSHRGIAGPAFDSGYNGLGFPLPAGGTGTIPAVMAYSIDNTGPFGLDPATLSSGLGATIYEPTTGGPTISTGMGSTIWRDLSINPTNGRIFARAGNQSVVFTRTGSNGSGTSLIIGTANGAFINGQNGQILNFKDGSEIIVYNDRPTNAAGQTFSAIKFINPNGTPATLNLQNADGTPFTQPAAGVGYWDFAWDAKNERLAILDFSNRRCYVFEVPQAPVCRADFNNDGFLDFTDFDAFVVSFELGEAASDFNQDGFLDFTDFDAFVEAFETGC